jgi:hypothetical protein
MDGISLAALAGQYGNHKSHLAARPRFRKEILMNDQNSAGMDQVKKQVLSFTRGEFFFAAGSLLAAICVFLPWVSFSLPDGGEEMVRAAGGSTSYWGLDCGWRGWATLLGGLLCAASSILKPLLAQKLTDDQMKTLSKITPIVGLVVFGIVLLSFFQAFEKNMLASAHPGIGLWLALLGMLGAAASVIVSNYLGDKPFAAFFAAPMFGKAD